MISFSISLGYMQVYLSPLRLLLFVLELIHTFGGNLTGVRSAQVDLLFPGLRNCSSFSFGIIPKFDTSDVILSRV